MRSRATKFAIEIDDRQYGRLLEALDIFEGNEEIDTDNAVEIAEGLRGLLPARPVKVLKPEPKYHHVSVDVSFDYGKVIVQAFGYAAEEGSDAERITDEGGAFDDETEAVLHAKGVADAVISCGAAGHAEVWVEGRSSGPCYTACVKD